MPAPDTLRLLLPVLAAMGLLLTAGVAALIHLVTQSRGNSAAWNHRLARFAETSPWRRADALFLLALLALAQIIRRPFPASVGGDVAAFQGVLIAGLLWRARGKVHPFGVPAPLPSDAGQALLRWLATLPVVWFAAITWQFLLNAAGHAPAFQDAVRMFLDADDLRSRILFVFFAVVVAPVAEEGLFRGLLLPMLVRHTGAGAGLALTAAGFAALHGDAGTFVPLAVFSVALSLTYARTGTLRVPILMHALFNAANLALMLALARAGLV